MCYYLSKGKLIRKNHVYHKGIYHVLSAELLSLWQQAQHTPAACFEKQSFLIELQNRDLVIFSNEEYSEAGYRLLTSCILKPTLYHAPAFLTKTERWIWKWISNAGFHLSISELIYLRNSRVDPNSQLFGF